MTIKDPMIKINYDNQQYNFSPNMTMTQILDKLCETNNLNHVKNLLEIYDASNNLINHGPQTTIGNLAKIIEAQPFIVNISNIDNENEESKLMAKYFENPNTPDQKLLQNKSVRFDDNSQIGNSMVNRLMTSKGMLQMKDQADDGMVNVSVVFIDNIQDLKEVKKINSFPESPSRRSPTKNKKPYYHSKNMKIIPIKEKITIRELKREFEKQRLNYMTPKRGTCTQLTSIMPSAFFQEICKYYQKNLAMETDLTLNWLEAYELQIYGKNNWDTQLPDSVPLWLHHTDGLCVKLVRRNGYQQKLPESLDHSKDAAAAATPNNSNFSSKSKKSFRKKISKVKSFSKKLGKMMGWKIHTKSEKKKLNDGKNNTPIGTNGVVVNSSSCNNITDSASDSKSPAYSNSQSMNAFSDVTDGTNNHYTSCLTNTFHDIDSIHDSQNNPNETNLSFVTANSRFSAGVKVLPSKPIAPHPPTIRNKKKELELEKEPDSIEIGEYNEDVPVPGKDRYEMMANETEALLNTNCNLDISVSDNESVQFKEKISVMAVNLPLPRSVTPSINNEKPVEKHLENLILTPNFVGFLLFVFYFVKL